MSQIASEILAVITLLNRIVVTGVLVTAFSLIIYIGLYNRTRQVALGFALVLACVIGTFLGDLLTQVSTTGSDHWLRLQWIGIAFIPAVSLALSDKLLGVTGDSQPLRRFAPQVGYVIGVVIFVLVLTTDLVAVPGISVERLPHLLPGPLFYPFTLFYFASVGWATYNVIEARRRSLTATSKRRMTYFAIAFARRR